jgi:O-antigen/teichoic acid export membrane protein
VGRHPLGAGRLAPGCGRASLRLWRELARYAFPLGIEGVGDRCRESFETVVAGRGLSTTALGHYRYGRRIAMVPGLAVVQVCSVTIGEPLAVVLLGARWRVLGARVGSATRRRKSSLIVPGDLLGTERCPATR